MTQDKESTESQGDVQPDPPTSVVKEDKNHDDLNPTGGTGPGGNDTNIGTLDNRDQVGPSPDHGKYTFPETPLPKIPGTS